MDERIITLAKTIVNYSIDVQKNEKILIISHTMVPKPLIKSIISEIQNKEGIPFVDFIDPEINALLLEGTNDERIEALKQRKKYDIDNFDAFITIRYLFTDYEQKNVSPDIFQKLGKETKKIDDIRINERKWVLLNYPSITDAQKAKMTVDEFYNFAMNVMTIDYRKMADASNKLKELMRKTDRVRITGPDTDLTFSIKDIPVIPCIGKMNIPDGECYTAPIKDSINGTIKYNTPTYYQGKVFNNIKFIFKDGKIIEASCNENNDDLNKILDSDEGSRYIGEFAIGFNPKIKHPMGDILYDEKIIGSIHLTPGRAYKDAFNGNISSIHWDIVLIQRSDYGGEIYFDDVLIRKDGLFVIEELKPLNYDLI